MIRYADYQVYFQHWPPEQHVGQVVDQRKGKKDGKGGKVIDPNEPWKASVYHAWWRYLSASSEYRAICEKAKTPNGLQSPDVRNSVYADFGDVFAGNFWSWWWTRGWALFCEPLSYSVRKLDRDGQRRWPDDLHSPQRLILSVAANGDYQRTADEIKAMLKELEADNRNVRGKKASGALYQPYGKPDVPALQRYFAVWDKRRNNPKMKAFKIMYDCEIEKVWLEGDASWEKETNDAYYRMYGKAEQIIKNAVRGIFPVSEELTESEIMRIRRAQLVASADRRQEIEDGGWPDQFPHLREFWADQQITSGSLAQLNL